MKFWSNPTNSDLTDYYRYVNELKPWTVRKLLVTLGVERG